MDIVVRSSVALICSSICYQPLTGDCEVLIF
jgi:hypothetical protein